VNQEGGGKNGSEESKPDPLGIAGNRASDSDVSRVESSAHPPIIAPDKNLSPKIPYAKGKKEIKERNPLLVRVIEDDDLDAFERKTLKYAKAGFAVGVVTIVLAGLTALIFYGQFKEAASQTDLLQIAAKQARRGSVAAGLRAQQEIAVLQAQATAAQDSVKAIQRQMRQDQRAWIKMAPNPKDEKLTLTKGISVKYPIRVTNIGKTPAKNVEVHLVAEILRSTEGASLRYKKNHERVVIGILFPSDFDDMDAFLLNPDKPGISDLPLLQHSQLESLKDGSTYLVIFGTAKFVDVFGTHHWVRFCTWHNFSAQPGTYHAQACTR
jgi:hypothetical protein